MQAVPDSLSAQVFTRVLAAKPHVAGTPAQRETADYVLRQMASWGLDTQRVAFRVYLPFHDSTVVERILPSRVRLTLDEPPVPGDPTTIQKPWPAMNGNSGAGDVTGPADLRQSGAPGRLSRARFPRGFGAGQDRDCALRRIVSRYQGARGGSARCDRTPAVLGSRRMTALSSDRCIPMARCAIRRRCSAARSTTETAIRRHRTGRRRRTPSACAKIRSTFRTFPSCRSGTATPRS